jgi:hypothetical protein
MSLIPFIDDVPKKRFTTIGSACGTLQILYPISHGLKPVATNLPTGQAGIEPRWGSLHKLNMFALTTKAYL